MTQCALAVLAQYPSIIVCAMHSFDDRELRCPRCGYDLRAAPAPRCSECGLTFPPEQWSTGVLREVRRTRIERADVWQPHQLLVAGLLDLLVAAFRPRVRWRTTDVRMPWSRVVLHLVVGVFWLWCLASVLTAEALRRQGAASPYACIIAAALDWAPRLVAFGVSVALGLLMLHVVAPRRGSVGLTSAQAARRVVVMAAGTALWVVVPMAAGLVVQPEFTLGMGWMWGTLALLPAVRAAGDRSSARGVSWGPSAWFPVVGGLVAVGGLLAGGVLLFPDTLRVPWWVVGG